MTQNSKRLRNSYAAIDRVAQYPISEAIKLLKQGQQAKFDETVELSMNLGIDTRHADQTVRGVVTLPNGTGKKIRVAVFAKGDRAQEAEAAGADLVGAEDLAGEDPEGRDRIRTMCRDAGDDGDRWQARKNSGAARVDAESQARDGHQRCRRGGRRRERRPSCGSTAPRRPAWFTQGSARSVSMTKPWSRT